MLRKTGLAALTVLTLSLTACGGPDSYTLRSDLCEVLDYQAFSRWFGQVRPEPGGSVSAAKVACHARGVGPAGANLLTRVEAYKYDSPDDAKQVFDRFGKQQSDLDAELETSVDDARYYRGNLILVLDGDLYLTVRVQPEAADDSSFKEDLPRLTVEFADQVLEHLREKS